MAKTISFTIRLDGSKQVLSEIDKIGKALTDKLKTANIKIDDKAFDSLSKSTDALKNNVKEAGSSIGDLTNRLKALQAEGKENTTEYKELTAQIGQLKVEQQQANDAIKRSQATLKAQADLQKLLNGEIKATDLSQKQFFQALNAGLDKADPKYQELVQDFVRLKQEEKEFRDGLRAQQRILEQGSDVSGRYRRLNAELVNARAAYRSLTDEEIRSGKISDQLTQKFGLQTNSVVELSRRIDTLDKELKETDARLGNFQRNVGNYTSAFRGLAGALGQIGIGIGISEIASATRQLISESTQLFDVQAKADEQLRTVLASTEGVAGRTLEQLKQFAQERQQITLFGDEETQRFQALLLTFTNIQGEVFDRATVAAQDYATALAAASGGTVDIRSASIQLGKALNDPLKGLTALGRAGVQFNEEQKALIEGFVEAGDLAAAQGVILGELERQFAGSAEAAARAGTGPIQQIRNQINDLKEEIGQELTPAFESFTRLQLAFFQRLTNIVPFLVEYGAALLKLATAIGLVAARQAILNAQNKEGALAYKLIAKAGLDYDKVVALLTGKINILSATTKGAGNAFRGLFKIIRANPILAAISLIAGLVIAVTELAKENETVRAAVGRLGQAFGRLISALQPIIDAFSRVITAIVEGAEKLGIFDLVVKALTVSIDFLAGLIDGLISLWQSVGDAAQSAYDRFSLVRTIVDAVRNSFNNFINGLFNLPSVFAGIGAAAQQVFTNIGRFFQRTALQAELLQKRLQLAVTFDDSKEADLRGQIEALRAQRDQFDAEGRSIGEAFTEAYNASVSEMKEVRANIDAEEAKEQAKEEGKETGQQYGEGFAEGVEESTQKALEARQKAIENIRELENELITNEFDADIQQAEVQAESDISGLVGDPEQIRRQTTLINAQLGLSIGEIESERIKAFADTIDRAKQAAANEIALLTGSPNEIELRAFIIRQSLITQIQGITNDRDNAINQAVADAQARRDEEIAALTGSPEEIESNAAVIRDTYARVIRNLGETRKEQTQATELEIVNLRRQIVEEFGGEISEDLAGASLEELQIAKDTLDQKLAILETELQRERDAIQQKALLKRQQLQIELQSGVTPERAQEIANELEAIDNETKTRLLESERDFAQERVNLIKGIVPESIAAANELAQAEIAINEEKNAKILEDTRRRVEQQKQLEQEIRDALIDAAFEFAGAAVDSFVAAEKQKLDQLQQQQTQQIQSQQEAQKESTRVFYQQQIAEAEGDSERQQELRTELNNKLVSIDKAAQVQQKRIDDRRAREEQRLAVKQALINGALGATKILATNTFPLPAVPLLIALAASIATQVATIKNQRFEEGGKLVNGLENYIVTAMEIGGSLPAPDINATSSGIPSEGLINGPRHNAGGVKASFNGTGIEIEGGEYKLRNGKETYIINRKSTKLFRRELDSLRGNTANFSPAKREAASRINAFGGNGVKFADGGVLGANALPPLRAPQALQNISSGVTREELYNATGAIYDGIQAMARQIDDKTDAIARESAAATAAVNARIDRLIVYTDPVDIVNKGNERKVAQSKNEL